jgi:hypothetical protein
MFRVEVTSKDGKRCGVPVQVDDHPGEPRPYMLNQIADSLRIDRDKINEALEHWTPTMLREHLAQYTQDELRPVHIRRR